MPTITTTTDSSVTNNTVNGPAVSWLGEVRCGGGGGDRAWWALFTWPLPVWTWVPPNTRLGVSPLHTCRGPPGWWTEALEKSFVGARLIGSMLSELRTQTMSQPQREWACLTEASWRRLSLPPDPRLCYLLRLWGEIGNFTGTKKTLFLTVDIHYTYNTTDIMMEIFVLSSMKTVTGTCLHGNQYFGARLWVGDGVAASRGLHPQANTSLTRLPACTTRFTVMTLGTHRTS